MHFQQNKEDTVICHCITRRPRTEHSCEVTLARHSARARRNVPGAALRRLARNANYGRQRVGSDQWTTRKNLAGHTSCGHELFRSTDASQISK